MWEFVCVKVCVSFSIVLHGSSLNSKLVFVRFSFPSKISPKLIRSEIGGKTALNRFLKSDHGSISPTYFINHDCLWAFLK